MSLNMQIGTAPDSWGVWFPSDPKQTPWQRFLDEVVQAGYQWIEVGPPGYLPIDPAVLLPELNRRGLKVTTGFVMHHFDDPADWPVIEKEVNSVGTLMNALGGQYLLLLDDTYTNLFTGERTGPDKLDDAAWKRLIDFVQRAGQIAKEKFGLQAIFHPHAQTHVEYEPQIEALLDQTDPHYVQLCLDTGHHAYCGGDPVSFMRKHHPRIPYLHLKSVDRELQEKVEKESIPFAKAVAMDVFCEPSKGAVDFKAFRDVLKDINYQGWGIVEQDMYPAPFDKPLPINSRIRAYLKEIGMG